MSDLLNILGGGNMFTDQQMLLVFFFYGLGFMVLGLVTFLKKSKIKNVDLTHSFYFLGGFGIIHGLTEWIDLTRLWLKISAVQLPLLDGLKLVFLTVSFAFLLQFGVNMLTLRREGYRKLRCIPFVAMAAFLIIVFVAGVFKESELAARYAFGFTGALLTTIALLELRKISIDNKLTALIKGSALMATAFGVYTVFGGLITFPIAGIPPQLVRMAVALLAGYASFSLLSVLETGLGKEPKKEEQPNK